MLLTLIITRVANHMNISVNSRYLADQRWPRQSSIKLCDCLVVPWIIEILRDKSLTLCDCMNSSTVWRDLFFWWMYCASQSARQAPEALVLQRSRYSLHTTGDNAEISSYCVGGVFVCVHCDKKSKNIQREETRGDKEKDYCLLNEGCCYSNSQRVKYMGMNMLFWNSCFVDMTFCNKKNKNNFHWKHLKLPFVLKWKKYV